MFGRRSGPPRRETVEDTPPPRTAAELAPARTEAAAPKPGPKPEAKPEPRPAPKLAVKADAKRMSEEEERRFAEIKVSVFNALIESVDLTELTKMPSASVRDEIGDIIGEIVSMKSIVLSSNEQQKLV
ncbi:MAG: CpaF family protein, partial [Alphaproteobacteria bacterium]